MKTIKCDKCHKVIPYGQDYYSLRRGAYEIKRNMKEKKQRGRPKTQATEKERQFVFYIPKSVDRYLSWKKMISGKSIKDLLLDAIIVSMKEDKEYKDS